MPPAWLKYLARWVTTSAVYAHRRRAAWGTSLGACLIGLVPLLLVATTAQADPFHSQTLPMGQRALGMGGAFTSIASDPSAVFYNPAGVALTSGSALSASLTLTAFDRRTVEGGYRTANGHSTLDHATTASLPVFVSAVKQIGRRDAEGLRHHGVALSTFTYDQRRLAFDVEVRGIRDVGRALDTLSIDSSTRTTWHAFTYAYRPRINLAFGISGILSINRGRHTEEHIAAGLGLPNADGSFESDESRWSSNLVTTNSKALLVRLGMLYVVNEKLRIGVMLQPPSLHVRGRARVRERVLSSDLTGVPQSSFFTAEQKELGAQYPIPTELRVGASYALRSWLLFSLDTSLLGPSGTKENPVVAVGPRSPDRVTGAVADVGSFYVDRWYRSWNGNLALGAEAMLRESIAVRAGLYTDLSSAPRVPKTTNTYYAPDVHRVGGTLSMGLVNDNYDISIGVAGLYGRGKGLSYEMGAEGEALYERTHVTDRMFLVFVNGVRNAVTALAKKTNEKLQEVRAWRELDRDQKPDPEAKPEPRK